MDPLTLPAPHPLPQGTEEEQTLLNVPIVPPLPVSTALPNITSFKNIKNMKKSFEITSEDLIRAAAVLEKLDDLKQADISTEVKRLEDERKVEIAKKSKEREMLKERLHTTYLGRGCLALGLTVFLDLHTAVNTEEAKNKLCNNPDEFIIYIIQTIVKKLTERIGKGAKKVRNFIKTKGLAVAGRVENTLHAKNLATLGVNAMSLTEKGVNEGLKPIDMLQRGHLEKLRTVLTRGLPLLVAPLKVVIAPWLPSIKIGCDAVQLNKILAAILKEIDLVYMSICQAGTWKEIAVALQTRAAVAHEKLHTRYIQVKDAAEHVFSRNTATKVAQGITSGFRGVGTAIRKSTNKTFKIHRNAPPVVPVAPVAPVAQALPTVYTPLPPPKPKGFFSFLGFGGRRGLGKSRRGKSRGGKSKSRRTKN